MALRVLVLCLVGLSWLGLMASPADAFSCDEPSPALIRPLPSPVLSQAPVFVVSHARDVRFELHDAQGNTVALDSLRVVGGIGCAAVEFFRAPGPLTAGESYELVFQDNSYPPRWQSLAKWKVSAEAKNEAQLEVPQVSYFRVLPGLYCSDPEVAARVSPDDDAHGECRPHAEVQVQHTKSAMSDGISWLIMRTETSFHALQLSARDDGDLPYYFYLQQESADDDCVSYELVDELGATRDAKKLCEPDRCARRRSPYGIGTIPAEIPFGASLWDDVPEANCAVPATFENDPDSAQVHVVHPANQGCALAPASKARPHLVLLMLLSGLVWRRRRAS